MTSPSVGEKVGEFQVVRKHGEVLSGSDLWADKPALFLFYIFDFSGDMERG